MPTHLPVAQPRQGPRFDGPAIATGVISLVAAACFASVAWSLPRPLLLPVMSTLLLVLAAGIALLAWSRPRPRTEHSITYWDLAGALTLFGIVAALLSDPANVIPILEARKAQ